MNLDVKQSGNKITIIFKGDDIERGSMTKDSVNDYLSDLNIAKELNDEEFDILYDEGQVEIVLNNKNDSDIKTTENKEESFINNNFSSSDMSRYSNLSYKRGSGKIYQYLEDYIDNKYWITNAVIRSGMVSYIAEIYVDEMGSLIRSTDILSGPEEIKLLKMIAESITPHCSGMDNRDVIKYKINKNGKSVYMEFIVDNNGRELKGKYTLEKRVDFLKRYGIEI